MLSELASPPTSSCSYSLPIIPVNVCDLLQKFLSAPLLNSVDVLIVEIHSSSHLHTFNLKLFKRTEAPMYYIWFSKNEIKLPMKMNKKYNHQEQGQKLFLLFSCSVTQSCLTLCDSMDCTTPGFPVFHHLPELAQTHVH